MDKIITDAGELSAVIKQAISKLISDKLIADSLYASISNEVLLWYDAHRKDNNQ